MRRQIASAATALLALSIGSFDVNVSASPWSIGVLGRARVFTASVDASISRFLGATRLAQTQDPAPALIEATIKTDKRDYDPGEIVEVTGAGWAPGEEVRLTFEEQLENPHPPSVFVATADQYGGFVDRSFTTELRHLGVSLRVYALGLTSGKYWVTSFVDAVSADLDQCANGELGAPVPCIDPGTPSGPDNPWQNGNLNQNQAHYNEGDSVPYRLRMTGLAGGSHTVTIEWDTTEGGKHTLDYLTSFDRTETTAEPCDGFGFCSDLTPDLLPIPADPNVVNGGVTPVAGNFALFNGDITSASAYTLDGLYSGNSKTRITLTFSVPANTACATAGKNDPDPTDCPVLAWGAHIATRQDWGNENSAVTRTGSPYHMRLLDLDGTGGNQDRSLSAEAVIFPGSLTIIKQTVPALNAQDFGFTTTGGLIPATFALDTDANATLSDTQSYAGILVTSNTGNNYTVAETPVALWTLSFPNPACTVTSANGGSTGSVANGVSINLREGENVTCTFINTRQSASLTLVKEIVNDNGGTENDRSKWQLIATGTGANVYSGPGSTGQTFPVDPDTYTLSETGSVAGYTNGTTYSCVKNGAGAVVANSITLANGDNATCTITNDDQPASLTVVKNVINDGGGTKVVGDFNITTNAGALSFGTGVVNGSTTTYTATALTGLSAGVKTLVEANVTGYTEGAWECTGQAGAVVSTFNAGSVALANGESVTCTITNNDDAAALTIVKNIVNDNGGTKVVGDFNITTNAGALSFGTGVVNGSTTTYTATKLTGLSAGLKTLVESNIGGYTEGAWECSGQAGAVVSTFSAGSVVLANGEDVTCTITNNDDAAALTIVKNIVNDNGGTKVVGDFNITTDAGTLSFGNGVANGSTTTYTATKLTGLSAGLKTLVESNIGGYTEGAWECSGQAGAVVSTFSAGSVVLGNGEDVTCTITNNDDAAALTIVKNIVNDNGGTKVVGDFNISTDAGTLTFGNGVVNGSTTTYTATKLTGLSAGLKTLVESNIGGYTEGAWECSGQAGAVVSTFSAGSVVLGNGEDVTCTITNNDDAASLTIVKSIVNDNGGTKVVGDFNISTDAGTLTFGNGVVNGSTTTYTATKLTGLSAGLKTLVESNIGGYTEGAWECSGQAGAVVSTFSAGSVVLANGEDVTCRITNNDDAAALTIVKNIVNDNGGTKVVGDFNISTNAGALTFGNGVVNGSTTTYTASKLTGLSAGLKTLVEGNIGGYTEGAWECSGQAGAVVSTFSAGSVVLANGEDVTCTITNNDDAASLTVVKKVVNDNGGTKTATDFNITTNAGALSFGTGVVNGSMTTYTATTLTGLSAGLKTLVEADVLGYSEGTWDCSGQQGAVVATFNAGSVVLGNGDNATCTIINNDQQGTLQLVKRVVNDHGGTKVGTDFGVSTDAGLLTFGGGVESPSKTFTYTAQALTVNAGSYTLRENDTYGYTEGTWGCTGAAATNNTINAGAVTVPNGIAVVCTITNDDQPGTIVVIKNATPAQGNFSFTTTGTGYNGFGLTGATANNGNKNTQSLSAGSYTVKEATQLGWILTGIGGSTDPNTPYNCVITGSGGSSGLGDLNTQTASIVLKNGDTVTCTFENTGSGASRTQGFWATHLALAKVAWESGTAGNLINLPGVAGVTGIGDTLICGRDVDASNVVTASKNQLMGGFWSSVSSKSDGKKRLAIDQGRMQLLQQLLAAELNASAFGSLPAGGAAKFAEWETALCGTNTAAISKAQSEAAAFNSKGDSTTFTPGTSADSKTGRFVADRPFWDMIKP